MAWIVLGVLVVTAVFLLMVFRQVSRSEERLRSLVIRTEARLSKRYRAKLVAPAEDQPTEPGP